MADWWANDPVVSPSPQAGAPTPTADPNWWSSDPVVASTQTRAAPPSAQDASGSGDPLGDLEQFGDVPSGHLGDVGRRALDLNEKLANGLTLGFAPRIGAAFDTAVGRFPTYADALKDRNATDDRISQEMPGASKAAELVGGALLPMGAVGTALKEAGTAAKIGAGALLGGGMGGVQGASTASDLGDVGDVANKAGHGALYGAALGAGLPAAGAAIGGVARAAAPFVNPSPVDGMSRTAFGLLSAANGPRVQGALDAAGPEGMLLDAAPQMKGLAQGVAIKPGDAQDTLVDALTARNTGTNDRLSTSVNNNLGPAFSPADITGQMQQRMDATGPMYARALRGSGPVDTTAVRQQLANAALPAKGAEAASLARFGQYLDSGVQDAAGNPLPEAWAPALQRAKFQMDADIAKTEGQTGSAAANATREMTGIRSALADTMADQIPGFADANLAYGTAARGAENFEAGRQALRNGANPTWDSDFAQHFDSLPLEQQALQRAGARSVIEEQMRTNPNDLLALRRVVGGEGDFNRGKMGTLFGAGPAQSVVGDIDRNTMYRNNFNEITQGSNTANKIAGSSLIDRDAPSGAIFPKNFTWAGLLANAGEGVAKKAFSAVAGASNDKVRMDLARALTAMGDARSPIAEPLAATLNRAGQAGQGVQAALSSPGALGLALPAIRGRRDGP